MGTNPDLSPDISNVEMQFDYRRIYANILHDWMGVEKEVITNEIFFGNYIDGPDPDGGSFQALDLASSDFLTSTGDFISKRFTLHDCYPNPARDKATVAYRVNSVTPVKISLLDMGGKLIKVVVDEQKVPGDYEVKLDLVGLQPGIYLYRMETGIINETKKLVIGE